MPPNGCVLRTREKKKGMSRGKVFTHTGERGSHQREEMGPSSSKLPREAIVVDSRRERRRRGRRIGVIFKKATRRKT